MITISMFLLMVVRKTDYKNATGIDLKSEREEYGGRFVIEQRVIDNRLQLNGSLNARRVNETWGNDGMFDTALSMNPTMPLYDDKDNYYQPSSPTGARNPVATSVCVGYGRSKTEYSSF